MEENDIQKRFQKSMETRIKDMNNLLHYNQFTNEEIRRLERKVRFLDKDITEYKKKIKDSEIENSSLVYEVEELRDEIYNLRPKKNKNKRKRDDLEVLDSNDNWIKTVKKKKPKKYKFMDVEIRNRQILNIFKKLNNINDIIELKDIDNLYDYLKNKKFENIYKLIPSLEELNKMIGMTKIKTQVFQMICYFVHELNNPEELNHIVITGPPGVGKTTLAKLLGNIYKNLGFLKNNVFLKARRSDLIGQYCGHTAVKTQKVIDKAEGGVLFIDEVYSLGNPGKRDVFTKECIDTINLNLTEKADKLLVIIAGYHDDVNTCFFNYNKGLERRFPLRFNIEKYSAENLFMILKKFVESEKWDLDDKILELIKKNYDYFKFMGGDMMTIFKFAKEQFSLRLMKECIDNKTILKNLTFEDFNYAIKKFIENKEKNKKETPEWVKNLYI